MREWPSRPSRARSLLHLNITFKQFNLAAHQNTNTLPTTIYVLRSEAAAPTLETMHPLAYPLDELTACAEPVIHGCSGEDSYIHITSEARNWHYDLDNRHCDVNNPLMNPAMPLEDELVSFTPATLEDMVAQKKSPITRKRLRFLDLPREIRNIVYGQLVKPAAGVPMDFANCFQCQHETDTFEVRYRRDFFRDVESWLWFILEWKSMKRRMRSLILVSRQISSEVACEFFAQPFRFTSDLGWVMLYHFLETIGPKARSLLKDITVCHPGFSVLPDYFPTRQETLEGPYDAVFNDHLEEFGLGQCLEDQTATRICSPGRWCQHRAIDYPKFSTWSSWKDKGAFDGPARMLREIEGLRKLTLVLPHFQNTEDQASFETLGSHPIHSVDWPQGEQLKLTVAHLIDCRHNCDAASTKDLHLADICLAEAEGKLITFIDEYGKERIFRRPLDDHVHPITNARLPCATRTDEARQFFAEARDAGWTVTEYMHDAYGHYPVQRKEGCASMSMCLFLGGHNAWHTCPGEPEVQAEHDRYWRAEYELRERLAADPEWKEENGFEKYEDARNWASHDMHQSWSMGGVREKREAIFGKATGMG